jgi:beta-glucanase (GH16 family)
MHRLQRLLVCSAALAAACFLAPSSASAAEPAASSDTLFFDDFAKPALDRTVWNVVVTGGTVNDEQQAYIDSTSAISIVPNEPGAQNGALVLQAEYRPGFTTAQGKTFDFTSGRIDSRGKAEFTYGTISARMKLPAGTGYWPAFWMLGRGRWPDVGEIDIMENVGEEDWVSAALHGPKYFGETPLVNKYFFDRGTDIASWHVYSVDWSKDTLAFAVDGRLIYRVTRAMVEHYGRWAFDAPKFLILNLALGGAYPVKINGADAPYNGMPESTVNTIKAGKGRVVVDWVCVTKPRASAQ